MSEEEKKFKNFTKDRISTIRLRTWTLTLAIIVSLIFYFLVSITTQQVNIIDFAMLATVQILVYLIYFPDGELCGQKNPSFISNRTAYNEKATRINTEHKIKDLRLYCKYEYEERKERYIEHECNIIGITLSELDVLKQRSAAEIKKIPSLEVDGRLIFFTKAKRKRLYNIIFKELPVEENYPETIMSAVEFDINNAIHDKSISFRILSYIRKAFMAIVVGFIFAYIGYTLKDGIGLIEIVSICMYLTTMFATAVMSFTSGETNTKVYKNNFYISLSNFIDAFFEWSEKLEQKDLKKIYLSEERTEQRTPASE